MPVLLTFDSSLAMQIQISDSWTILHAAVNGLQTLIKFMIDNHKVDTVSLTTFSNEVCELRSSTMDFQTIIKSLDDFIKKGSNCDGFVDMVMVIEAMKKCFSSELDIEHGLNANYSYTNKRHVVMFLHHVGIYKQSQLNDYLESIQQLPFILSVFHFGSTVHPALTKLVDIALPGSKIYNNFIPLPSEETSAGVSSTTEALNDAVSSNVNKLIESQFRLKTVTLKCGCLTQRCKVYPDVGSYSLLEILGFTCYADIKLPPLRSRHLLLPIVSKSQLSASAEEQSEFGPSLSKESELKSKSPCLSALLHGGLKTDNQVAIARIIDSKQLDIGNDKSSMLFGMIYGSFIYSEPTKRSNLMLALFPAGDHTIPWLGKLSELLTLDALAMKLDTKKLFPVPAAEKRSYSQNRTIWVKPTSLQADIQKILRHARKLPERNAQFYREVNRVRTTAFSLHHIDLLTDLVEIFRNEFETLLTQNSKSNAARQIKHVIASLEKEVKGVGAGPSLRAAGDDPMTGTGSTTPGSGSSGGPSSAISTVHSLQPIDIK